MTARLCITLMLAAALSVIAQNSAPIIPSLISPSSPTSDSVRIPFRLADAEGNVCTVSVSWSLDNGQSWAAATISDSIYSSNSAVSDTIVWLTLRDIGARDIDQARVRLTPRDQATGQGVSSASFSVENFTRYDFSRNYCIPDIDTLAHVRYDGKRYLCDTVIGIWHFVNPRGRVCSLALEYSIDNAASWNTASSDLSILRESAGTHEFSWYSKEDLDGYQGGGVLVRIIAVDTATGKQYASDASWRFILDNRAPDAPWAGAVADSAYLVVHFPPDVDSVAATQASRYSLNYGRKVTGISRSPRDGPLTVTYALKGGPDTPEAHDYLYVQLYYGSTYTTLRQIAPDEVSSWTQFTDTIPSGYRNQASAIRFYQYSHEGFNADVYYIDDVLVKSGVVVLFSDTIGAASLSGLWPSARGQVTTSQYNSGPYALALNGTGVRYMQTQSFSTAIPASGKKNEWYIATDGELYQNLVYSLTIDTLFDFAGNYSTSVAVAAPSQKAPWPEISITTLTSVLSGFSALPIQLGHADQETLSVNNFMCRSADQAWKAAAVPNESVLQTLGPSRYSHSIQWRTAEDFPGKHRYDVDFQAQASFGNPGPVYWIQNITIQNNALPQVALSLSSTQNDDTVRIQYAITDENSSNVGLRAYFSANGLQYFPAQLATDPGVRTPETYSGTLVWPWKEDAFGDQEAAGEFYFKVIPWDSDTGSHELIRIAINATTIPTASVSSPTGEQHDSVSIFYQITDRDSSQVTLVCEHSTDNVNWKTATTATALSDLGSQSYSGEIVWLSRTDLPGASGGPVWFRVIPRDSQTGSAVKTEPIYLDNNQPPMTAIAPITETQNGTVTFSVHITDQEYDTVDVLPQYRSREGTWTSLYISSIRNLDSAHYADSVHFSWYPPFGSYAESLEVRIASSDADTGDWDSIGFYYSNKAPVLELAPIAGSQSGAIPVRMALIANTLDSVLIRAQYSLDGASWIPAQCAGDAVFSGREDSVTFIWDSRGDLDAEEQPRIRLRLRGVSHISGIDYYTEWFSVDNNAAPMVELIAPRGVWADSVPLKALVTDAENDAVSLVFQCEKDNGWQDATIEHEGDGTAGPLIVTYSVKAGPESPEADEELALQYWSMHGSWVIVRSIGYSPDMGWDYYADTLRHPGAYHTGFRLRFYQRQCTDIALDNYYVDDVKMRAGAAVVFADSFGLSALSSDWQVNTNNVAITGAYFVSGAYSLKFDGSYGERWAQTKVINTSNISQMATLDSALYADTVVCIWRAGADLNVSHQQVRVRARAADYQAGSWDTATVWLDQQAPELILALLAGEYHGDVAIRFGFTKLLSDSVTVEAQYAAGSGGWRDASLRGPVRFPAFADSGFVTWRSVQDLPQTDTPAVRIRVRAIGKLSGAYATSGSFSIDNNEPPTVRLIAPEASSSQSRQVDVRALLSDSEADHLHIALQYRTKNSDIWKSTTVNQEAVAFDSSAYTNDTVSISWNSTKDLPDYADTIYLRAAATDNDTSAWDSVGFFSLAEGAAHTIDSI